MLLNHTAEAARVSAALRIHAHLLSAKNIAPNENAVPFKTRLFCVLAIGLVPRRPSSPFTVPMTSGHRRKALGHDENFKLPACMV